MFYPRNVQLSGTVSSLSGGRAGIFETLRVMRNLIREGRKNLEVRTAAANIIHLVPEKSEFHEVETLFEFVRNNIRYTKDIVDVETLMTPEKTLALGYGDCDDQTVLLASLFESVGYPTRLVVAGYDETQQLSHVYLQVAINGEWFSCDPTEHEPFGWEAPGATVMYFEQG